MMRSSISAVVLVALVASAACYHGGRLSRYPAARQAAGIDTRLALRGDQRLAGELIVVEENALVLRVGERFQRVPYSAIVHARLTGLADVYLGGRMTETLRERARLNSRFPAGLTPELERALLAAYGQDSIATVGS